MLEQAERYFPCPYCGSSISMLLDPSVGHQAYTEDCEVCCRPIEIEVRMDEGEVIGFQAKRQEEI